MKTFVILLLVALVSGETKDSDVELPPSLKTCHTSDPSKDRCIKELIQAFLPLLRKKTPNFDFPIIDPYKLDFVSFKFTNVEAGFNYTANMSNVQMYGLSRVKVRNMKSNFKNDRMRLEADMFVSKLLNTGNYSLSLLTSILYFNHKSQGSYKVIVRDVNFKAIIKGKLEKKSGEDHMKVYRIDIDPDANDMEIYVSDEFIDEVLGNFNSWRLFYKDILKTTHAQWQPLVLDFINPIFEQIPFRKLIVLD